VFDGARHIGRIMYALGLRGLLPAHVLSSHHAKESAIVGADEEAALSISLWSNQPSSNW
jgi:hypothetical protein